MDADEYRRSSLANWEAASVGWERRRADMARTSAPVTEWLAQNLAPAPGDVVLDLAAGPGDTGFAIAPMLGEEGRLISSDFSPEMVEVGRRRAAELGLTNVEHRVVDAERIELEDDSVDGVVCRFGYMLMADPAQALAETRRVLRPSGHLVLAVWREAARNPWAAIAGRVFVERGLVEPPEPGGPGPFVLGDEERLRELLGGAGFAVERLEDVPILFRHDGVDAYVAMARDTSQMFARIWGEASEDDRDAIKAQLAEAFSPYAADGGYDLPGVALCVVAR